MADNTKLPHPHVDQAIGYARGVVSGLIDAGQWVVKACARMLRDLERAETDPSYLYYFNTDAAEAICLFVESLEHVKDGGRARSGDLIVLRPWQCFILCNVFGWLYKSSNLRRFRELYAEIPRKNGKSVIAAGIGLFMFSMDGESGAEVYSGATSEKQAWEVFKPAREMCVRSEALQDEAGIEVNAKTLSTTHDLSVFAPVIGKPGDGSSPSCSIIDEFHEHDTPDLYETMVTGQGARRQPLTVIITTAGTNVAGPCYDKHLECQKVLDDVIPNDELFCIMYGIDVADENAGEDAKKGDDWADPKVLAKANPNYDVSVFADFLVAQQRKALFNPAAQHAFKTKHLNVWGGARAPWMPMYLWDLCAEPELTEAEFAGAECFGILDLASKDDIAVWARIYAKRVKVRDKYDWHYWSFANYYIPEALLHDKDNPNQAAYLKWHKQGFITATEGDEIDFDVIQDDVVARKTEVRLKEVVYDAWRATQLAQYLKKKGVKCVELPQQVKFLSSPMKETLSAVKARRFHHDGNPVTKWMVSNVTCKTDAKDNIYPRKERPQLKIDGGVAIIMGMARASAGHGAASINDWIDKPVVVTETK
jgi:phage terminase large subunit-like protein